MKKLTLLIIFAAAVFMSVSCTAVYRDCPYKGAVPGIVYVYTAGKYVFYRNQIQIAVWTAKDGRGFIKSGENISGIAREYYGNGSSLKSEVIIVNNQFNFIQNVYFNNGGIWKQYTYKNDVLEGEFREFYENGNVKSEYRYSGGKLSGPYREYYEGGQLMEEGKYVNGEKLVTRKYVYTPTATWTAVFTATPIPALNNAVPLPIQQSTAVNNQIQYIVVTATVTKTPQVIYVTVVPFNTSTSVPATQIPQATYTPIPPKATHTPLPPEATHTEIPPQATYTPIPPKVTHTPVAKKTEETDDEDTKKPRPEPTCSHKNEKDHDCSKHEKKEVKATPTPKSKTKKDKDNWKREYHERIMDNKEDARQSDGDEKDRYKEEEQNIKAERKEELETRKNK